jgi:hypothetical protein
MSKVWCSVVLKFSYTVPVIACLNSIILGYLQLATLTGHTYRVLYLAISPDGQVSLRLLVPMLCLIFLA